MGQRRRIVELTVLVYQYAHSVQGIIEPFVKYWELRTKAHIATVNRKLLRFGQVANNNVSQISKSIFTQHIELVIH